MNGESLNDRIYLLLKKIEKLSKKLNSISESVSDEKAKMYEYLKKNNLVNNLKINYYYGNIEVELDEAILTERGYSFMKEIEDSKKPMRMTTKNRYEQIQVLLKKIEDGEKDLNIPNARVAQHDHDMLIQYISDHKLVEDMSPLLVTSGYYQKEDKEIVITTKGYDILDNPYKKSSQTQKNENHFYIKGDSRGSTFGSGNVQNNK